MAVKSSNFEGFEGKSYVSFPILSTEWLRCGAASLVEGPFEASSDEVATRNRYSQMIVYVDVRTSPAFDSDIGEFLLSEKRGLHGFQP